MTTQDRAPAFVGPLALFLFALSGAAGLIYQSIWAQYLGLFLGHAAYAQSLVLAIFMGGMAVGAWWASVRTIHWRNLLRAYAWIELAIGLAAAAFHPVYLAVTGFAYEHAFPALAGGTGAQVFKWCCAAVLIFPQAVLLGSTFPLMSNGLMRRLRVGNGAILGGLYFTNSVGAAVGALVATFVLLPTVGLPGAMRFGALLNILVAAIAFLLSGTSAPFRAAAAKDRSSISGQTLLLSAAFVTGATSFVYEIGWVIFAGADRQLRLNDALKLLSNNWKAGVLLLVPLFYRTIRAFLERVEEVAGMKARQPQEQESRPNPEQI